MNALLGQADSPGGAAPCPGLASTVAASRAAARRCGKGTVEPSSAAAGLLLPHALVLGVLCVSYTCSGAVGGGGAASHALASAARACSRARALSASNVAGASRERLLWGEGGARGSSLVRRGPGRVLRTPERVGPDCRPEREEPCRARELRLSAPAVRQPSLWVGQGVCVRDALRLGATDPAPGHSTHSMSRRRELAASKRETPRRSRGSARRATVWSQIVVRGL